MKGVALAIFSLFAFSCEISFAQNSFKPATIVMANGDTAAGFIKYARWQMTPSKIQFRKELKSSNRVFRPAELRSFEVGGDTYTCAAVELDFRYDDLQRMNTDEVIHTRVDTLFLKREVSGAKPLYSYKDHVYHFYIMVNDSLRLLRFKKYKSYASSEVAYLGHGRVVRMQDTYLWQLQEYLPGCHAAMPVITSTEYTLQGMLAAFKAYNECPLRNAGSPTSLVRERR